MSQIIEIKVPDIGDYKDVPVIEVLVKAGDKIEKEQSIVVLESDKATMDVPSSHSGLVKEVKVKVGDSLSEGSVVITLEEGATAATPAQAAPAPAASPASSGGGSMEIKVPDIGDYKDVPVIEVLVKAGDKIEKEQSIVVLESDKATMDVPSTHSGVVKEVKVKVGDNLSEGSVVLILEGGSSAAAPVSAPAATTAPAPTKAVEPPIVRAPAPPPVSNVAPAVDAALSHASPSVRKFARELGVTITQVKGSGPKGRITQEDVQAFVKAAMSGGATSASASSGGSLGGLNLIPWPKVDFTKFGEIERQPLNRIKKLTAANLGRNWVMIPAVTYHEDADITDLEAFRVLTNKENEKKGVKITMLAFLMKAAVAALKKYPEFNSSLDGDDLILKKYFNIGFAADTPTGLVVPVIKDADKKGIFELAKETSELAALARDGKLKPDQMQGASFTISSLGGIGGTYFSPIVNAPEVAILGVSKAAMKPVWDGKQFVPRLICPLSLSADHRVIDGALATRFNVYIAQLLADFRRASL
ncbi:dihydrolipoyllysine-residue acetyltransferase [Polynucleobacter sp. MWH-Creno-3A4]|jgi:pyruvate dehydrogenase E2 component (dihydrolipoamide acetyltransferase)|uniref:dihydrolipoyllysine-residue acetyltransferase n=1 Tax=Polynucleobacter sp. MWH-Creno-3A4 TaxID=1855886 RepID=UPI001C0CFB69|nr:dihydrolipoyllysine-residue acetyltransferase [Polynucleobacter sp. MWH-Creno-3A4]MBU3606485.1 dihydrolipoyllysine-residue acetyltransferase [Polynucleobacter sp. MWH-Creno-3A4]